MLEISFRDTLIISDEYNTSGFMAVTFKGILHVLLPVSSILAVYQKVIQLYMYTHVCRFFSQILSQNIGSFFMKYSQCMLSVSLFSRFDKVSFPYIKLWSKYLSESIIVAKMKVIFFLQNGKNASKVSSSRTLEYKNIHNCGKFYNNSTLNFLNKKLG